MRNPKHTPVLVSTSLALLLICFGLSSCGGSDSLIHVEGSSAVVTRPMLDHWMRMWVGGDFRANVGHKGPVGLVSEPANYPECAAAAKTVVRTNSAGRPMLSDAQISQKCHLLYQAIKAQALSFLLSVQWTVREGAEQGLRVSNADLHREYERFRKEVYKAPAEEQKYLTERHWTRSDVLYQLKRNILVTRILPKFKAKVARAGGGERTYTRLALVRYQRLIAKTTCKAGYVVVGCREYREPAVPLPSPSVILESLARG